MQTIEYLPVGTKVLLGDSARPVHAVITSISITIISEPAVQYRCAWFDGSERHCEWLEDFEVTALPEVERLSIGFKQLGV